MRSKISLAILMAFLTCIPAAAVDFGAADLGGAYGLRFTRGVDYPASDALTRLILGRIELDGAGRVSSGRLVIDSLDWDGSIIDPGTGQIDEANNRTEDAVIRHESTVSGTYSVTPEGLVSIQLVLDTPEPGIPAGGNSLWVRLNYPDPVLVLEGVLTEEGSLVLAGINRRIEQRTYNSTTQLETLGYTFNDSMSGELRRQRRLPGRPLTRVRPDLP